MIITLTGPNDYLLQQNLQAIKKQFIEKYGKHGVEQIEGESLELNKLPDLLQGSTLFAPHRLIILLQPSENKAIWDTLIEWLGRVPSEIILILVEPNIDRRTKAYKTLKRVTDLKEFTALSESELVRWLQQKATSLKAELASKEARYLLSKVGSDQWRLENELKKLANASSKITVESIDTLTDATSEASAFVLLDAALAKKSNEIEQLVGSIKYREDPHKLFGLLVSQVHALAIVHSASTKQAEVIAKESGIHPFVIKKTQPLVKNLSQTELQLFVETVALCDMQLKSTGIEPWVLLEQCLGKISKR